MEEESHSPRLLVHQVPSAIALHIQLWDLPGRVLSNHSCHMAHLLKDMVVHTLLIPSILLMGPLPILVLNLTQQNLDNITMGMGFNTESQALVRILPYIPMIHPIRTTTVLEMSLGVRGALARG